MEKENEDHDSDGIFSFLRNIRITELARHKRERKKLQAPFHRISSQLHFSSWKDDFLPLVSWAALTVGLLDRDAYLACFRQIITRIKKRHEDFGDEIYIDHRRLKNTTNEQFDDVMQPILANEIVKAKLKILSDLATLPDQAHWKRHTAEKSEPDVHPLAKGFMKCFDHQSQEATDVRWLILMTHLANNKLVLAHDKAEDRFDEVIEYPNKGDMRMVRPFIRAGEIGLRQMWEQEDKGKDEEKPPALAEALWSELHLKTPCFTFPHLDYETIDTQEIGKEIADVYAKLVVHFHETIATTGIDAKHDTTFGTALFCLSLIADGLSLRNEEFVSVSLLTRSIVEAHINLRYLKQKDDKTIWLQFRNFGNAQTKLALLKYLDYKEKPDYIDIEQLHSFANHDLWIEFQDIELGNWAKKNLREIAAEVGLKDVYDQHYQILSITAHAHWPGIRETNFTVCMNPLHRFHLIPDAPKPFLKSHVPEMCKITNQVLDDLNALYPSFKPRLRKYKEKPTG